MNELDVLFAETWDVLGQIPRLSPAGMRAAFSRSDMIRLLSPAGPGPCLTFAPLVQEKLAIALGELGWETHWAPTTWHGEYKLVSMHRRQV